MLRIACPYCGERDHVEFVYGGDATEPFPDLSIADIHPWVEYVFLRDNPVGAHSEYWQHQSGCRQWLRVVRDTVTHRIHSVTPARGTSGSDDAAKRQTS
jgi:heterotetrameric sarcosine oxidase delta subunit